MKQCKVLMPIGGLGAGIHEEALDNGMAMGPDAIAINAGSTDSGPRVPRPRYGEMRPGLFEPIIGRMLWRT
jgi:hypothetical protein